jgi:hypothetical protein
MLTLFLCVLAAGIAGKSDPLHRKQLLADDAGEVWLNSSPGSSM